MGEIGGVVETGAWLDSTLEAGTDEVAVSDRTGGAKGAGLDDLPVRDPVEVFRATLAERAKWQKLFREAGLTRIETEHLLLTIEGARGREDLGPRKRTRAVQLLLAGRDDWFEGLLDRPAILPEALRAALASVTMRRP
jgi:hypothetical protein